MKKCKWFISEVHLLLIFFFVTVRNELSIQQVHVPNLSSPSWSPASPTRRGRYKAIEMKVKNIPLKQENPFTDSENMGLHSCLPLRVVSDLCLGIVECSPRQEGRPNASSQYLPYSFAFPG